jgi:hypothetical protein
MLRMIVAPMAIVVTLAGVPAFAQDTNSSTPPPQGEKAAPPQSTPIPPPQTQPRQGHDCEHEDAIS